MEDEGGYSEEDYPSSMPENAPKKKPKSEDLIIEAKNFFNSTKKI